MAGQTRTQKIRFSILMALIVISGLVGAAVMVADNQIDDAKSTLAEFILENPESTALAAYTFDENGEYIEDGHALFYNADSPLVMASTVKIVVLAVYANAVASGNLDPDEQVSIEDLERFYLPNTDGSAHVLGLQSLGVDADERGFALDPSTKITLDDIATIMIHFSGNAETDYLISRLGKDLIAWVMREAGLPHHTPVSSILGPVLAGVSHESAAFSTVEIQPIITQVASGDFRMLERLAGLYLNDSGWRARQIEFMDSTPDLPATESDIWAFQQAATQLLPRGTAREYARMMAHIASGKFISTEVSLIMQEKLESLPSDEILRLLYYDRFGAKDGAAPGVLTLAAYAVPKRGPLGDRSRVVVVIVNSMPMEEWVGQLKRQGHYLLPIDLAQGTGVFYALASHSSGKKETISLQN